MKAGQRSYGRDMIERPHWQDLAVALLGGVAVTLIGLAGSELLFAPGSEGIGLGATLLPSLVAGLAMFAHLMRERGEGRVAG
jgi:hypothetical protein